MYKKIIDSFRICKFMLVVFATLWSMTAECKDYTIKKNGSSISAIDDASSQVVDSGTDAATIIQGRINSLTEGGRIFISSGTYILSAGLKIYNSGITLEGAGYFNTVLKLGDNINQNVIELSISGTAVYHSYLAFRNLKIDGNRDYNNYGCGIYGPANRCLFEDIYILNCPEYGIYITPSGSANRLIRIIVESINLSGIYMGSGSSWVTDSTIASCQDSGIKVCSDFTKIYSSLFWGNTINVSVGEEKTQSGLLIYDSYLELSASTKEGIKIGPFSLDGGIISGNSFKRVSESANIYDDISSETQNDPYQMTSVNIRENYFSGDSRYNIYLGTRSKDNMISGNMLNSATDSVKNLGTSNYIYGNKFFVTEDSGTTTLNAGQTTVVVSHNLALIPTRVQLTPTKDTAGKRCWVDTKTLTTFTIHIDSTHTTGISFDWWATAETN